MTNFSRFSSTPSHPAQTRHAAATTQALEITLHDGLDRLEDFALMMAFQSSSQQFDILTITPPTDSRHLASPQKPAANTRTPTNDKVVCIQTALLKKTA